MFTTGKTILPFIDVAVSVYLVGLIALIILFLISFFIVYASGGMSAIAVFVIGLIALSFAAQSSTPEYTNKISEAEFIDSESFSEKIIKIGKLDNLSSNSKEAISDVRIESLKNSYIDLSGMKDNKKVDIIVEFSKNDTMTVKVSKGGEKIDEENYESFEYAPKK